MMAQGNGDISSNVCILKKIIPYNDYASGRKHNRANSQKVTF